MGQRSLLQASPTLAALAVVAVTCVSKVAVSTGALDFSGSHHRMSPYREEDSTLRLGSMQPAILGECAGTLTQWESGLPNYERWPLSLGSNACVWEKHLSCLTWSLLYTHIRLTLH